MFTGSGSQSSTGNVTLLDKELMCLSKKLDWLAEDDEEKLPGPIAFEYARFKTLMHQGSITESCWKITNLCEVIISYLWAACIEQCEQLNSLKSSRIISISVKLYEIQCIYPELNSLLDNIRAIKNWRNRYGIGHGSLIFDYSVYVESLSTLTADFLKTLKKLPAFLTAQGLSLYNSKGTVLVGRNYHALLDRDNQEERFYTKKRPRGKNPIRSFGYQMDLPDIYFFVGYILDSDNSKEKYCMYRNYAHNRAKYIKKNGDICWQEDWEQISLLYENEFKDWLTYFKKRKLFPKNILSIAEKYQEHGMYAETKKCIDVLEGLSLNKTLKRWVLLLKYAYSIAIGDYIAADALFSEINTELVKQPDLFYEIKVLQTQSWYKAIFGYTTDADMLCKKGIILSRDYQEIRPFTGKLLELDIRKNRIYALRNDASQNPGLLRDECLALLQEAELVYQENQGNRIIHDVIGFSCNLYSTYTLRWLNKQRNLSLKSIDTEKTKMFKIVDHGISIRREIFEKYPNDIWAIRGYAWSLHTKARLYMTMGEKLDVAQVLLCDARDLRNKEITRADMGLKEDLVKNYLDLFLSKGGKDGGPELVKEISKKIQKLVDKIREKEGSTVRIQRLLDKIRESGLVINAPGCP